MYPSVTVRVLAVAVCGWLLAGEAGALSLGKARGVALIGRPLDVTIPVSVDASEVENLCPGAELFYGDSRISTPSVRWEASGATQGVVRVQSSAPVDEPMVTVYLKVGCQQASTRRYVFLAELPPEDEMPARSSVRAPALAAPARPQSQAAVAAKAPVASPRRREAAAASVQAMPQVPPTSRARPPAPATETRARRKAASAAPPQARLKLEPLDLSIERDPVLRLSPELAAPVSTGPQQRANLSALWQALQKTPEASVQEAVRLQALDRELESLRAATRQNAAALTELRGHVERAQSDRKAAVALVLVLGAALLALLAWMAWRWYRARQLAQVGRWFEAHGTTVQADVVPPPEAAAPVPRPGSADAARLAAGYAPRPPAPPPLPRLASAGWVPGEEFQASRGGTMRMVGVQELIDVHDKADFFLSIGETEQAIAALEAHVHDQVDTGALAWMDLLELYHSLGRRADFDRLRREFRQRFAAQVPDFEHFGHPTASLENYSRALSRIVALWPSHRVLDAIEESIFRKPGAAGAEPFTLEAYRELVLLYHIAKDLLPEDAADTVAPAPDFGDTSLQPLHTLDRPAEAPLSDQERLMIPPASARLGVDIDLEEAETRPSGLPALDFDFSTFDPAHGPAEPR